MADNTRQKKNKSSNAQTLEKSTCDSSVVGVYSVDACPEDGLPPQSGMVSTSMEDQLVGDISQDSLSSKACSRNHPNISIVNEGSLFESVHGTRPSKMNLECPKCLTALPTKTSLNKHLETQPKYCMVKEEKRSRNRAPTQSDTGQLEELANPVEDLHIRLAKLSRSIFLPRHIPHNTREAVASHLTRILENTVNDNTPEVWAELLTFCFSVLGQPKTGPKERPSQSLSNIIRQNIQRPNQPETSNAFVFSSHHAYSTKSLRRIVTDKIQDGDISGAVKIISSSESILPPSSLVLQTLKDKHPANRVITSEPPRQDEPFSRAVSSDELRDAILSFPQGSAGGPDGFRPQYLKELINIKNKELSKKLILALAGVCNLMLKGLVPLPIVPLLYGANLFALRKIDNGVRPIAVGLVFRRLVAKIVTRRSIHLNSTFQPTQLGFATRGGAEAAVHAARSFIETHAQSNSPQVLLKIDVKNAFNTLDRNCILDVTAELLPEYCYFVWQCYGAPSLLLFGQEVIWSRCGVQQGDPLGPLLYCAATYKKHLNLKSSLVECYLDDDVLGGIPESVFSDFTTLTAELIKIGLKLNISKCEIVVVGGSVKQQQIVYDRFLSAFPSLSCPSLDQLSYLGSPLTCSAIPVAVTTAKSKLQTMASRLEDIPAHQALFLLKNCLGPVKLLYLLRTSRAYNHTDALADFDETVCSTLSSICNIEFSESTWLQSSLPVSKGGLGIRSSKKLALPAFLASPYSSHRLSSQIIPFSLSDYIKDPEFLWCQLSQFEPPQQDLRKTQNAWDEPVVLNTINTLKRSFSADINSQARLNAVSTKESGAWLGALPAASLGNLLNESSLRIAVALRLGAPVSAPHSCICSAQVDTRGYHALSCKLSAGRRSRHAGINAIIKRALVSAGIESELEPAGIVRSDGKRPDGVTLSPWERGKCLTWDATCSCTMALSNLPATSRKAGEAARLAEQRKHLKYRELNENYLFRPLAFETLGPWGPDALSLISEIGNRIRRSSGEPRSTEFLRQRLSIEIQRGNAASVLGTVVASSNLDDIFSVIRGKRVAYCDNG